MSNWEYVPHNYGVSDFDSTFFFYYLYLISLVLAVGSFDFPFGRQSPKYYPLLIAIYLQSIFNAQLYLNIAYHFYAGRYGMFNV